MQVHNVCQLMNVSDYKVWKLLDIYVDKVRLSEDLSGIDVFGMNETATDKKDMIILRYLLIYTKK